MARKFWALTVAVVFLFGSLTLAAAQPPAPAPAPATKPAEKMADKPAAKLKQASGTVKSASDTTLVVEATQKDKTKKEWSFALDKTTKLTKGGKSVTLKDVVAGDSATVSYEESGGKMTAKRVTLKAPAKAASQPSAAPKPAGQK